MSGESLLNAVNNLLSSILYDGWSEIPSDSKEFIDDVFTGGDYETLYRQSREGEVLSRNILLEFENEYPGVTNENNIDSILEKVRQKQQENSRPSVNKRKAHKKPTMKL